MCKVKLNSLIIKLQNQSFLWSQLPLMLSNDIHVTCAIFVLYVTMLQTADDGAVVQYGVNFDQINLGWILKERQTKCTSHFGRLASLKTSMGRTLHTDLHNCSGSKLLLAVQPTYSKIAWVIALGANGHNVVTKCKVHLLNICVHKHRNR